MATPEINTLPDSKKYYTALKVGPYKRGDKFELSKFAPNFIVHLPLPTELRDDTTVGYTNVNLETVGDAINKSEGLLNAGLLRNTGNILNAALSGTSGGIQSALANKGVGGQIAGALGGGLISSIQSLLPAEQINSAVQQQNGVAPNPNPSVQFQGPVLRDFSFTWAFYPKNKKESEEIDGMIRKLKARALPSFNKGNGQSILEYPHICQLNFYPWDNKGTGDHGWNEKNSIIKIKRCFMSGVNVNYHAYGTPAFFEGTTLPVTYQLTINFKEIEYLTSGDWDPSAAVERPLANTSYSATTTLKETFGILTSAGSLLAQGAWDALGDALTTDQEPQPPSNKAPDQFKTDSVDRLNRATEGQSVNYTVPPTDPKVIALSKVGSKDSRISATKGADGKWTIVNIDIQQDGSEKNIGPEGTFTNEEVTKYFEDQKVYTNGYLNKNAATAVPDAKAQ